MANTHCDFKISMLSDKGNEVTVIAYFNEGYYDDVEERDLTIDPVPFGTKIVNRYIRTGRIDEGRLVTLYYDYYPVATLQIKQDLYDLLLEEKGNLTVIPECIYE